jgi:hypothetical protein
MPGDPRPEIPVMSPRTCPVTDFPVETQHPFAKNRELVRGKPYERDFNGDLWVAAR